MLILCGTLSVCVAAADENSTGYHLALLQEQALNPEKMLLRQVIQPEDAMVREFDSIIETLRYRCNNPEALIVATLVETWRTVQRRGYDIKLLDLSRELGSFTHIVFQRVKGQKIDFRPVSAQWLKDKYPIKK